jgi:hypothetical protein
MIYGKAHDVNEEHRRYEEYMGKIESESLLEMFDRPTPANKQIVPDEQSPAKAKLNDLLERLREAAYAGRIKFRAIKEGEDPANGYRAIDPLYFYVKPVFNWSQDVIFNREDESATVWYFVHLDREQFASLLREMGVLVQQNLDADVQQNLDAGVPADLNSQTTYDTGLPGRRSSKHLFLPEAQRRRDAGGCPETLGEFAEQLLDWLKRAHPFAAQPTIKTIKNHIGGLFRAYQKRPK